MTESITKRLEAMPDFLTGHDLVALGLYKSNNCLYLARTRGQAPDHIQFVRKILYPRDAVIAFVQKRLIDGSVVKTGDQTLTARNNEEQPSI